MRPTQRPLWLRVLRMPCGLGLVVAALVVVVYRMLALRKPDCSAALERARADAKDELCRLKAANALLTEEIQVCVRVWRVCRSGASSGTS